MVCNTVLILGVGRSGTTALYTALQKQFYAEYGQPNVRCVYEPFLWDRQVFDKPYEDARIDFTLMESISHEGIHESKQLPMFISREAAAQYSQRPFIREISCCPPDRQAILSKLIRANGRYHLLRAASPEARIIFIIRNPLDVVNSSSQMFSFYGDDFHTSDLPRFEAEVEALYGETLAALPANTYVQRQARYWYFMNRHFLESAHGDSRVLLVNYESLKRNRQAVNARIAEFIGMSSFSADRGEQDGEQQVGPSYSNASLSRQDLQDLQPYITLYNELLSRYFDGQRFEVAELGSKYQPERLPETSPEDAYLGRTPLYLKNVIQKQEARLQEFQHMLDTASITQLVLLQLRNKPWCRYLAKRKDKLRRRLKRIQEKRARRP